LLQWGLGRERGGTLVCNVFIAACILLLGSG